MMLKASSPLIQCLSFIILLLLIHGFILGEPATAFPEGLESEGRIWLIPPFAQKAGRLAVEEEPPVGRPVALEVEPEGIRLKLMADESVRNENYALRILADPGRELQILLNGRNLDVDPIPSDEGLYYRLNGVRLSQDENILEIKGRDSEPLKVMEVEAFSLLDAAEEVHFHRLFSGKAVMVQPPTHPNQDQYDVQHYDLEIKLNMASTVLDATLTMTARSLNSSLQVIPLDLNNNNGNLVVSWVDQGMGTGSLSFSHSSTEQRLFITLPAPVPTGTDFTVRIKYGGTPKASGTFGPAYVRSTHGSPAVPVIYTFSEPYGARDWWPCKDVPNDKATMELRINCPIAYTPISNGKLLEVRVIGDGTHTYHWSETYPMSTYLASICCTNYQASYGTYTALDGETTMDVAHYLYPENFATESPAIEGTLLVLNYFSELFGEYPFLSEKYYTASHNSSSGMEHQTATSLPGLDLTQGGLGRRNIHELAHMWFGDLITMEHFDHLWLNEGFATYSEALWDEHYSGKQAYHNRINGWTTTDLYPLVGPDADRFLGSLVYRKGAWVLHMLRRVIGDEDFFQAVRNYVAHPDLRYGNALSIDLQREFESQSGQDLNWFFDQWLYRAGRPSYQWAWATYVEGASHYVDLQVNQVQSGEAYLMPLEFEVTGIGGETRLVSFFNNQKSQSVSIDVGSLQPSQVHFDPENWVLKYASQSNALSQPILSSVLNDPVTADRLLVSWQANPEANCIGYELYISENLTTWALVAGASVLPRLTTSHAVTGLVSGRDYYFRLRAMGSGIAPSVFSNVYGAVPSSGRSSILVVEGYDRWRTQAGRGGSYDGAYYHGKALHAAGAGFDTCDNDVVGVSINLSDYPLLIWVLGEESTEHETFSSAEQTRVAAYLDSGGYLFVSGAEIGWDLDNRGSSSDRAFYRNYLKAIYVGDSSNTYFAQGLEEAAFAGVETFRFDDGSFHSYDVRYPDRLGVSGGSVACLRYVGGTGDTAAVQYSGTYRLINLGFPFETIVNEQVRHQIMGQALNFFGMSSVVQWNTY